MPTSRYDLALVTAARDGDGPAIRRLLAVAQPDIRRYARRTCAASDVEDAVQETLWVLYRRVGTLRTLASFSGWLFAVVRRECLRIAARLTGRPLPGADEPAWESDEAARLDVAAAIESLPPHYREVVILRDFEELTVDEIGARLGLTRESVQGRLHRARALLREYLA